MLLPSPATVSHHAEEWAHAYNSGHASGGDESELEEIIPRTPVHERPRLMHRDFDNYGEIGEVMEEDMPQSPSRTPRHLNTGTGMHVGMIGGYGRHSRNVSNVSITSDMMTPTNAGTGGIVIDGNKRWSMTMGTGSGPSSPSMPFRTTTSGSAGGTPVITPTTLAGGARGSMTYGSQTAAAGSARSSVTSGGGPVQHVQAYAATGNHSPPMVSHSIAATNGLPPQPRRSANLGTTNGTHSRQSSAQLIIPPMMMNGNATAVAAAPPPPPFASLPIAQNGNSPVTGNSPVGTQSGNNVNGSHSPLRAPLTVGGSRASASSMTLPSAATSQQQPRGSGSRGSPGSHSRSQQQQQRSDD